MNELTLHYRHREQTQSDISSVTSMYKGLEPKKEMFTFSDGRQMELINLQGTIPVCYKKNTYNIPICIWLMDTHPENAPICYLKPTANMKINVSMHVDYNGKIFAPYLHQWAPGKSNLLMLVQTFIILFSEKPPLYSLPANKAAAAPVPTSTPYPLQPSPYYMPMPSGSVPSPYPSYGAPMGGSLPYPTVESSQQPQPPYPISQNTPYPPYPTASQPIMPQQTAATTGTITEAHIRASLLSAAEDKIRRSIRERVSQWRAELETLQRIQEELMQGKDRLGHLLTRLEAEQCEWEKVLTTLRDKDAELDGALVSISNQGEVDVDEAVVTTAPLYKQLLNVFAEEAATEDAIYYLGEGLRRGVIDLDVFLKHVRSLSRKQFMLRALMHRCRSKAGLASS